MAVTRTEIVPNPGAVAVAVKAGQFLHFILDAGGPMPIWSFASNIAGTLFQAPDIPGHPLARYEWDHLKKIDAEILNALPVFASLHDTVLHTYDQIQKAAQLAVIYTATIRTAGGFNKHRAAIAYDYGLSPRVTWTANCSVDYVDKKAFGSSSTSGRVATEFIGDVTSSGEGWSRAPIRLSFSGEVKWASDESTTARVQTKLTIPLTAGFDLPIAYQYGKPDAQSASGSEARVGLSVDLSRLLQSTR
jgi:hypothetical protein